MCAPHHRLEFISRNPHNQIASNNADAHAISIHEGQATKHSPFFDARDAFQQRAYSRGELFVVCHRTK
jgi:hypothetical protein